MENEPEMDAAQAVGTDPETYVRAFYLVGKLASELPKEDTQPSAALYRAVCEGDVCATKLLLESEHNPNLPYYFPRVRQPDDYLNRTIGRSIEDERGMFHYPLHRAVLLTNVELVGLLLEYGGDPNALDGRSNSPLAMLIKSPVGIRRDENGWSFGNHGKKECHVVKLLLRHDADITGISTMYIESSFASLLKRCCWSWDKETAHEAMGELLDTGCDARLCSEIVENIVDNPSDLCCDFSDTLAVRALTILLQAGFDVDHILEGCDFTPLHTVLQRFAAMLENFDKGAYCSHCRETDSVEMCRSLSRSWLLVKAGAQIQWTEDEDTNGKLATMEMTLSTFYDMVRDERDRCDSFPYEYALSHLHYCKDVLKRISLAASTVRSLFDLSALAVRKSLGWNAGRKVTRLAIPEICQDAVLLKEIWSELWSFVETTEQCGRLFLYEKRSQNDSSHCLCPSSPHSGFDSGGDSSSNGDGWGQFSFTLKGADGYCHHSTCPSTRSFWTPWLLAGARFNIV